MNAKSLCSLLTLAGLLFPALSAQADPTQPWELRNSYRIPIEKGVLIYAEDTAEWRVFMDSGLILADRVGFRVQLEDGTEFKGTTLGDGVSGRERFTDEFGEGMVYSVAFTPKNGVRLTHYLKTYRTRPFVFIEIAVENVGATDVKVAAIQPVKAEKSVMQALSPQATVRHRRILDTGGQPVAAPGGDATMAVLHDPSKPISFGVGLVPRGQARSVVAFNESGGEWHGEITCNYEPYKTLKAGEKLLSDPLWLSHGVPEPDRVDMNYSWVYSVLTKVPQRTFDGRGWFTLDGEKGLDAYVAAAGAWRSAGIDHVLLAKGWEGRPGSMEGASGRFPKSMKEAIGGLDKAGFNAGVTIDPLAARGDGAAKSADGQGWINPATPEGTAALNEKIGTLKSWGAAFVVVDYSAIPDDVLAGFNLTRAEAQHLAYKALHKAADPLPVYPSSVSSVGVDLNQWLDAGSAVARMAVYGMTPGPLCCVLAGDADFSDDAMSAAQFWPGPIEFRGTLEKQHQNDVEKLLRMERIAAHPLDAGHDYPKTWRFQKHDAAGAIVEDRTMIVGQFVAALAPESTVRKRPVQPVAEKEAEKKDESKPKAEAKAEETKPAETQEVAQEAATAEAQGETTAAGEQEQAEMAEKPAEGTDESAPVATAEEAEAADAEAEGITTKAENTESKEEGGFMKKLKRAWPL